MTDYDNLKIRHETDRMKQHSKLIGGKSPMKKMQKVPASVPHIRVTDADNTFSMTPNSRHRMPRIADHEKRMEKLLMNTAHGTEGEPTDS